MIKQRKLGGTTAYVQRGAVDSEVTIIETFTDNVADCLAAAADYLYKEKITSIDRLKFDRDATGTRISFSRLRDYKPLPVKGRLVKE